MKIHEAAITVLRDTGHPMHANNIYSEITKRGLFKFGAKDPVAIVAQTLRKKSNNPINKGEVVFIKQAENTYGLAEWDNTEPN